MGSLACPPMKTFLAFASVACLALSGCGEVRDTMMVVPDRQGHASADVTTAKATGKGSNAVTAGTDEMYITLGAQDSLSSVAKAYGITLEKLIARNRLTKSPKPGDNLVVPKK